jgi:hypothetical protein
MASPCKNAGEASKSLQPWEKEVGECCTGLVEVPQGSWGKGCEPLKQVALICSNCGNNVCEPWENNCNCPADCKEPEETKIDEQTSIKIVHSIGSAWIGWRDTTTIYSDGAIREEETTRRDAPPIKKAGKISRQELEELARFITEQGFFEMKSEFACKKNCPTDAPISWIEATVGDKTKKITIKQPTTLPSGLKSILEKIRGYKSGLEEESGAGLSIEWIKKITIDDAARPEIIATKKHVFVLYLGHISGERTFSVKVFDSELAKEIAQKDLVFSSAEYGDPTDIRADSDKNYLYAFYETGSMATGKTYLWGKKYSLDEGFEETASTGVIASSKTFDAAQEGDERLDDPIVVAGENSVFVITRYNHSFEKESPTKYKAYEFTKELEKIREFDLDLSGIADGGARQASAIRHNGNYYMVLPTTVGKAQPVANITPSDIIAAKFGPDWNIEWAKNISTDNSSETDAETYITGFEADNKHYYLVYNQIDIPNIETKFEAPLKIYDKEFNLVKTENTRSRQAGEPGLRPSLEVHENKIFVGHSTGKTGKGTAEVHLYEIK